MSVHARLHELGLKLPQAAAPIAAYVPVVVHGHVVVELPREDPDTPLDPAAIDADLGPAGPIARLLPKYEDLLVKVTEMRVKGETGPERDETEELLQAVASMRDRS